MRGLAIGWVVLAAWVATGLTGLAQSAAPDERGLWKVWVSHTNAPDDHLAFLAACREYTAKTNQDPLVVVARGLEAWHLLKSGSTNEAMHVLNTMLAVPENASPLQKAGADIARSWMTRIDREMVRLVLKKIYLRDIEFPESLDAIKALKIKRMPPFEDRWGKSWVYKRGSSIKGMEKQLYTLESTRLGSKSDIRKALAMPYAVGINLEPVRVSAVSSDTFEFSSPSRKSILLQAGADMEGVTLAYIGVNIIVMADDNHWRVVLKPR